MSSRDHLRRRNHSRPSSGRRYVKRQKLDDSHSANLAEPNGNGKYTQKDVDFMSRNLAEFFMDDNGICQLDQLRPAEEAYMGAVNQPGVSPVKAFQDVAMTTFLGQEMDTLYASEGGIFHFILNNWSNWLANEKRNKSGEDVSTTLWAELKQASSWRKVEEIKKLMTANNLKDADGDQAVEEGKEYGIAEAIAEVSLGEDWVVVDSMDCQTP